MPPGKPKVLRARPGAIRTARGMRPGAKIHRFLKENLGFQWSRWVPERPGNVPREHESRSGDVPGLLRGSGWVPGTSPGSSRRHF